MNNNKELFSKLDQEISDTDLYFLSGDFTSAVNAFSYLKNSYNLTEQELISYIEEKRKELGIDEKQRNNKENFTTEINPNYEGISKINLSSAPMRNNPKRDDRAVHLTDKNGNSMKTSRLMMGYNKQNIELENGDYLNIDEFMNALKQYLSEQTENTNIVAKKTGKVVSIEDFEKQIRTELKATSTLIIGKGSKKIKHTKNVGISIKDKKITEAIKKGILFLKKDGLELEHGNYIYIGEIKAALDKYMMQQVQPAPSIDPSSAAKQAPPTPSPNPVIPSPKPVIPSPNPVILSPKPEEQPRHPENKPETAKRKNKAKKIIIATITGITILALSVGINLDKLTHKQINDYWKVTGQTKISMEIDEQDQQTIDKILEKELGDNINVKSGVNYYESSDYKYGGANSQESFGNPERPAGTYKLSSISIIDPAKGEIEGVSYTENTNLYNFTKQVCEEKNLSLNDVEVMLHIDGPVSGWINAKDLSSAKSDSLVEINHQDEYHIHEKNMGAKLTTEFKTAKGEMVTIKVKDENGNNYQAGTEVKGSDGKIYTIEYENETENLVIKPKLFEQLHIPAIKLGPQLTKLSEELKLFKEQNWQEEQQKQR